MITPELLDKILLEWSYRCDKGYPDVNNPADWLVLENVLVEMGIESPDVNVPQIESTYEVQKDIVYTDILQEADSEDTGAGEFEQIAVDLWNTAIKGGKLPLKYKQYDSLYKEMSAIVRRLQAKNILEKFSGQHIPTSEFWIQNSGGKSQDEPKTDVISQNNRIRMSVKKGKSQLMSPEKKEAIATFKAVAAATNIGDEAEREVLSILNKFAERTRTVGFNTKELANSKPSDITGNAINEKAKKVYDLAYAAHKQMEKKLNSLFQNNKEFERAFLYEAASGYIKFDNSKATANYLLAISGDANHVKLKRMYNKGDEAISELLGKVKVSPSMKSNSYKKEGKKVGYAFYSSLRIQLEDVMKSTSKILGVESKLSELHKNNLITEAWYTDLLGKVKSYLLKLWNRLIAVAEWIQTKFIEMVEYAKSGFDNLLEVAELEPDVSDDVLSLVDFY